MVQSYDIGSLPFVGDLERFLREPAYFEERVAESFLDKLRSGLDVANYPQFRDMSKMFLASIDGIERVKNGYAVTEALSVKPGMAGIPEVCAIKKRSHEIYKRLGKPFKLRVCVTGPYTMSSVFLYRDCEIISRLGDVVSKIVENSLFKNKYGEVELVAVDEPVFGLLDDPLLDFGSEGREVLLKTWEDIFHKAKSKNTKTCVHLHSTSNELFWEVDSLNVVESHAGDSLYFSDRIKRLLEEKDKFLKASTGITDFNKLIRNGGVGDNGLAATWRAILRKETNPITFLETVERMEERLAKIIGRFGVERVPYAGLECGLKSFPTYESAIEYLKRSSESTRGF